MYITAYGEHSLRRMHREQRLRHFIGQASQLADVGFVGQSEEAGFERTPLPKQRYVYILASIPLLSPRVTDQSRPAHLQLENSHGGDRLRSSAHLLSPSWTQSNSCYGSARYDGARSRTFTSLHFHSPACMCVCVRACVLSCIIAL